MFDAETVCAGKKYWDIYMEYINVKLRAIFIKL